ncbi:MAG: hypothetical protein KJO86_05460 [Muriicola sp.]|nr:hypothetical protein [Muriicola sp.]
MKTLKHFYQTIFILLLLIGNYSCESETVVITLTVDTAQLGNDRNNPGGCSLSATPASVVIVDDGDPKTFTIRVDKGTQLTWEGVTTTGDDIKMKNITYVKGTNIFNRNSIPGKVRNGKEKVKGKARRKTAKDKDYVYKIKFKVDEFGNFTLDPKIRVK